MKSNTETLKQRMRAKKCLHCDGKEHQRGLCAKHYMQFRRAMLSLPKNKQRNFDLSQIESGNILAAGHIRELTTDNLFREAAK